MTTITKDASSSRAYRASLLVAILAFAALAWWLARSESKPPEPGTDAERSAPGQAPAVAFAGSGSAPSFAPSGSGSSANREQAAGGTSELQPLPAWVVRVLARDSQAPVPGTMVYLDHYRIADLSKEQRTQLDENVRLDQPEKNLEAFAPRARTDANGCASFPRVPAGATCWALGGWYGSRFLGEQEPNPCVMLVDLDTVLRLQALDQRGHPVEGPLQFSVRFKDGETWLGNIGAFASSGAYEARIVHFATRLREALEGRSESSETVIFVEAGLVLPTELRMGALSGRDQLVTVSMPACGAVRVRVTGLTNAELARSRVTLLKRTESGGRGLFTAPVNGVASFGAVGLGSRLQASLDPAPRLPVRPLEFSGPTKEGEVVEVELRF